MSHRLGCLLLVASLLLALGGPVTLAHHAVAHEAGHAHAHAHAHDEPDTPAPAPPAAPEPGGCGDCHLLLHAAALTPPPAADVAMRLATAFEPAAAPAAPSLQLTRDRPPGRAPPRGA